MDDIPTCPPKWPQLLWGLHFHSRPWPGPGPVNYPPIIEDMMASLHVHTLSYLMMDEAAGNQIRTVAEQQLMHAAQNLSTYHKESAAKVASIPASTRSSPSVPSVRGPDQAALNKIRASAEQELLRAAGGLSDYMTSASTNFTALPAVRYAPNAIVPKGIDQAEVNRIRAGAEQQLLRAAQGLSKYQGQR